MDDASGPGVPLAPQSPTAGLRPLLRLAVVVLAGIVLATVLGALPVLVVVLALVAMIMLHELGHFATAKWSGMKVTEYFLGFGPRLWSIRRARPNTASRRSRRRLRPDRGMTMLEDVAPVDEARSYRQRRSPRSPGCLRRVGHAHDPRVCVVVLDIRLPRAPRP